MHNFTKFWIGPVVSLGCIAAPAHAAIIWTNSTEPNDPAVAPRMAWFDSADPGNIHWGGTTGLPYLLDGLDFTPDHTLYGFMDRDLYTINTNTGHADHVAHAWPLDPNDGGIFMDLSWDPAANQMYGVYACSTAQGGLATRLYKINLADAHVTLVGTVYYWERSIFPPGGLATTKDGVRYIDDMGGWLWELGPPEGRSDPQIPAERRWRERDASGAWFANVFGGMTIDWSRDGVLYHMGWNLNADNTELWTVNTTSGEAIREYAFGSDIYMLSAAIDPVPEPSTLIALILPAIALRQRRVVGHSHSTAATRSRSQVLRPPINRDSHLLLCAK
jgi:hypothetical protein